MIKMETRHIRIDYEDALNVKKNLLTSEINLLQTLKKVKNYKTLRKKEMTEKNKLKTKLASIRTKLNLIESSFPQEETKVKRVKKRERISRKNEEISSNLHSELQDIKEKLAKLGK